MPAQQAAAEANDGVTATAPVSDAVTTTRSPTEKALLTIVILAIGFTLYLAASLILPILIAAFLSILLAPAVRALVALRIPQPAAAGLVVTVAVGIAGLLLFHLYAPVQSWLTSGGPAEWRILERKLRVVRAPVEAVKNATQTVASIAEGETRAPKPVVKVEQGSPLDWIKTMHAVLLTTLSTILLVYFLLASGDLFLRKLVQATPRLRDKIRTVEIAKNLQREISAYFGTITLVNTGLGLVTGTAMWLLGMPTPLVLGVMVALLNFLPYLGPMLASVILAGVAIVTFDTPLAMVLPPLVYLTMHLIEGQVVVPFVLGRRMAVNPVILFLWVLIFTWMWGAPGAVIAVPMLVAVRICAERIELLRPLAGLLALDEGPAAAITTDMQGSSRASQPLDDAAADATRAAAATNTPPAA
jgi:predicted PurR-regulated permease PerM